MKNEKKSAKPVISLQAYTIENLQYTLDKHVSESIPVGFHLKPSVAITDDLYHGKLVLDVSLKIGSESINTENNAESKAILITISAFLMSPTT
ncbi:hypothetical protein [Lacticaseibacillus manihotivorans]|uniref:hypothetical protein n=1 Tax=Lacticaseibacillus manihotivorans TaxID=88233 RepID=UPI0006D27529|nr:hypothetical protein [Lacticaseibacillus manihotivorans]